MTPAPAGTVPGVATATIIQPPQTEPSIAFDVMFATTAGTGFTDMLSEGKTPKGKSFALKSTAI